jgi:outer membrane protein TolC
MTSFPRSLPVVVAWLALASWPVTAKAQAPRPVTLAEALAAVEEAPQARVAELRTEAARVAVGASGGWPATSIGVGTAVKTARFVATGSVPLPIFGTLGASRRAAEAELDVARADRATALLDLRRDVRLAWAELAFVEARADLSDASARREQDLAAITRERFDADEVSRVDVVQAEAAAGRAATAARTDRMAVAERSAALAGVLGWDPAVLLHAQGGLPSSVALPALADAGSGLEAHPRAKAAEARVGAEASKVDVARHERFPRLSFDIEADVDDPTLPGTDVKIGLGVELPLFGHTGAAQRAAEASRRAASEERQAALGDLGAGLVAAYRRCEAAIERARALGDEVVPAQRELARLAREAYQEGEVGLYGALEADRSLAETELELIEARADAAMLRAELDWAMGVAP